MSYLNTKPLLYGLQHGTIRDDIELTLDYPSNLVEALKKDQIDIGLLPVAALADMEDYQIVSNFCIGTEGEVASVCVFSDVPLEEIETVLLDYQSRTSVLLCKILFAEHWKKSVQFIDAKDESYIEKIKGNVAGLVIGDRALRIRNRYKYIYDLGLGWKEMTGLPFVFAVWVTIQPDELFQGQLEFCSIGLSELERVIAENPFPLYNLEKYYKENVAYRLTPEMRQSIQLYLSLISG